MERLVLTFSSGDDCTYSCDNNLPFLAESKIAAELELLDKYENSSDQYGEFQFHGHTLNARYFSYYDSKKKKRIYIEPQILTLDEWFERYCEEKVVDAAQN